MARATGDLMKRKVAVVGLGMAAKPHVQSWRDLAARAEVAAWYSPSAERRARFTADHGWPATGDLDAILADTTITAVSVLTPPWTHLDLVKRCAAAGKHVLLEKPIEATLARSIATVEACERAGVRLGIVFQHRFRDGALRLYQILPRLGRLLSCSASVRWWRAPEYFAQAGRGMKARDGGGVLLTQAIHTLDLFLSLTGPVAQVTAFHANSGLRKIDTEDVAGGAVRFANGALGVIDATTTAFPGHPERIELAGEHGSAVLETARLSAWFEDGTVIEEGAVGNGGGGADPMAYSHEPHCRLIADFLDALDEGRDPRASGRSALDVHRLIDAMLASNGRAVEVE
jgi:predicted dehydrogenase